MLYEIEFCTDSKTYEYEIDARTGAVLTADSETGSLPTDPDQRITAAQAREKVLEHLGMEADAVTFKKVELDHDDNRMRYEIVLVAGSREYEYELDAQDGAVLSWDYEELENDDLPEQDTGDADEDDDSDDQPETAPGGSVLSPEAARSQRSAACRAEQRLLHQDQTGPGRWPLGVRNRIPHRGLQSMNTRSMPSPAQCWTMK